MSGDGRRGIVKGSEENGCGYCRSLGKFFRAEIRFQVRVLRGTCLVA
jgi:hypothetical protein